MTISTIFFVHSDLDDVMGLFCLYLKPVTDINKEFLLTELTLTGYYIISKPFFVKPMFVELGLMFGLN